MRAAVVGGAGYAGGELLRLLRESGYDRVTLAEIQGMPDADSGERLMRYYKALWTELNSENCTAKTRRARS